MSDLNIERRRLSEQMRQDLKELTFSASMRAAVLARIQQEAGMTDAPEPHHLGTVHDVRQHLHVVPEPPQPQRAKRQRKPWLVAGGWLAGGTVAAAAIVLGIVFSGPSPITLAPQQELAGALGDAGDENFTLMSATGIDTDDADMKMALIATDDPGPDDIPDAAPMPTTTAAVDEPEPDAPAQGEGAPDGETATGQEAEAERRPSVGVAAQQRRPGSTESKAPDEDDGELAALTVVDEPDDPTPAATLGDLNKEAELVVLARVKGLKGNELTLTPVQALKGTLPKGDLAVTIPAGDKTIERRELVVVFLRQAEVGHQHGKRQTGKQPDRWLLAGGMAGIFRLDDTEQFVTDLTTTLNLDVLKDEKVER